MAPLDIPRLAVGDRVQHELLVREREDKTTRGGDPFVVLRLGNATGQLSVNADQFGQFWRIYAGGRG